MLQQLHYYERADGLHESAQLKLLKIAKGSRFQKIQRKTMKTMKTIKTISVRMDTSGVRKMRRRSKEFGRRRVRRTWIGG